MMTTGRTALIASHIACWNWKCAILSATVRSLVYLAAMARSGFHGRLAVVVVEVAYVTLTAGLYAGWQQKALSFRSRLLGNVTIAGGVPAFSQWVDWLAHRASGVAAPARATVMVCIFTALSALFHLYVMRRGVFLTGRGRSLLDDFRSVPHLVAGFVLKPVAAVSPLSLRVLRSIESQIAV